MANHTELDPNDLNSQTFWRSVHYRISHIIGPSRPYRFFLTYWGRLLLLLLICIIVVLGFAYIYSPAAATAANNTTSQGETPGLSAGNGAPDDTTVTAGETPVPVNTTVTAGGTPAPDSNSGSGNGTTATNTSGGTPAPVNAMAGETSVTNASAETPVFDIITGSGSGTSAADTTGETPVPVNTTVTSGGIAVPVSINVTASVTPAPGNVTNQSPWSRILGNVTPFTVGGMKSVGSLVTTDSVAAIVVLFAFGFIAYTASKSHRQVVVGKFENHIGGDDSSNTAKFIDGGSSLLTGELHRLRLLYSQVDDRRAISSVGGRKGPLDYAIIVGDPGKEMENLISKETTMKIGPIEFPIGTVSVLLGKIFAGPQIIGGFHQDGNSIILNAFMSGSRSRSWRVDWKIEPQKSQAIEKEVQDLPLLAVERTVYWNEEKTRFENLEGMVKELAFRIFTDLTSGGTTNWRATYAFTEGLRSYRSCLLSKKDQINNLKNAERRFFEAISEDSTFDLAWYNLGVVYTELENLEASDKAFLKAIKVRPERWEPYYALALNRFNKILREMTYFGLDEDLVTDEVHLQDVIHPCKQAIALNPTNPHLHMLIGVCYRMLAIQKRKKKRDKQAGISDELFRAAAESHNYAVKRAWDDFCDSQYYPADTTITRESDTRKASSAALWDLARTYYSYARCNPGKVYSLEPVESVLLQALSIDQTNAAVVYNLGIVYYNQAKFPEAAGSFESATQIDPTNLKYWLLLALASQKADDRNRREIAVGKVLEFPSWMQSLSHHWKKEISEVLPWEGKSRYLRMIFDFQKDPIRFQGDIADILKPLPNTWTDILHLVNNPPPSIDLPAFEKGSAATATAQGCSLAYHLAHHTAEPDEEKKLYQIARENLPGGQQETGWSRWVRGIISYELASFSDPMKNFQISYNCFKDNHPLEMKNKGIQTDLAGFLLEDKKTYEALSCASKARHMNPLGFAELFTYGYCFFQTKDLERSLSAFESALLLKPYDVDTLSFIGHCYWNMGLACEKRDDKEKFWRQAIQYYDRAREALRTQEFKEIRSAEGKEALEGSDTYSIDRTNIMISCCLGNCYFELSKYGKAVSHYDLALQISSRSYEYEGEWYSCILKCAEALLHKRDHDSCEKHLSVIIDEFYPSGILPGQEAEPPLSEEVLLHPIDTVFETTYAGEVCIKALLGQAYSYAERDAGLDNAFGLIKEADRVEKFMKKKLDGRSFLYKQERDAGLISKDDSSPDEKLVKAFLTEKIPLLEAEILDRCGWVHYKKEDLEVAKNKILKALSLKADAGYNFHLANVYATLFYEDTTEKKPIYGRRAVAYCDHALDIVPRPGLEKEAKQLMDKISGELDKKPG